VAIGAAATYGDTEIEEIVAVTESGDIVPPCGMFRELISDYSEDAKMVMFLDKKEVRVSVLDLFPHKYRSQDYPNRRE